MNVWHNGKVALAKDLIFGLVVMSESGWIPVASLDDDDFDIVFEAWDYAPGNPYADNLTAMHLARKQQKS